MVGVVLLDQVRGTDIEGQIEKNIIHSGYTYFVSLVWFHVLKSDHQNLQYIRGQILYMQLKTFMPMPMYTYQQNLSNYQLKYPLCSDEI